MQLHLVRHPRPQIDSGICYGRTDLTACPSDLERVRHKLAAFLPNGMPVFTSPLRRCAELADTLKAPSLTRDARLAEFDFGAWEKQPWQAIPRTEIDAWAADVENYRPGNGESLLQMAERVTSFYHELQARHIERAMIICHAGTIRHLTACLRGLPPPEMARFVASAPHAIDYGEILTLNAGCAAPDNGHLT